MWPVTDAPIGHGAILVDEDGRIQEIGPSALVPLPEGAESIFFPRCLLTPGIINAHTHLELTNLRGKIQDPDFFDWIQHLRREKADGNQELFVEACRVGIREFWSYGVTCVADTGDSGSAAIALSELGGRGIAFQEVFGPHPDQRDSALAALRERVKESVSYASEAVRVGVSPHAPYTVSEMLYCDVAAYARAEGLRIAVHVAESISETKFIVRGEGPFADAWQARGIPQPVTAESPVAFLERAGVLGPDLLAIHCVHVSQQDILRLADSGTCVVVCSNSNARHGHGLPNPLPMIEAGISVGVGTDSVASLPVPDPYAEARALVELGLSKHRVAELLTIVGARATGWDDEIGSLETGKWADLCVFGGFNAPLDSGSVAAALIDADQTGVVATFVAGRMVHGAEGISADGRVPCRQGDSGWKAH